MYKNLPDNLKKDGLFCLWKKESVNGGIPSDKSHSEADMALCAILAFWCRGDMQQMDRLFRQSGLYREKWERNDYRINCLSNAVCMVTQFYK
jgi:putative DNA primase/helicase